MSNLGYRVFPHPADAQQDAALLDQFAQIGVAQISDCMQRLYGVVGLRPFHQCATRMVGFAVTVKVRPGDNLMIHKAMTMSGAHQIIVVDGHGDTTNALVGELMMLDAQRRGIVGFVIDGAIRDSDVFAAQSSFGCFARDVSHLGPYKDGPGEVNVPVSVGGQVVQSGDIIVGDCDGVVAVPYAQAHEVLALAQKKEATEQVAKQKIAVGTYTKPWLEKTIAERTGA
ncbi:RraA family protein [Paenalcaligenes suwonensis]|uniref:RraA family protein n=1 Tax=Paenalcaligenes suwonensis TaxID=1202713 RepID=UPI00140A2911|nr:RraA family protein [Paenalcaligenes suwonensis]NHC61449.1 RraA family protein [Paenalcaligenes suwonensis]